MPSIDVNPPQQSEESKTEETTTLSKPVIGIIYPPPEVRNIVDKTASFVARNGPEFEHRIRQNEVNNPKFNFLNPADAYHAYYQHKVKEFKEGKGQEPVAPKTQIILQRTIQEPVKIPEVFIPKDPPAEFEFIVDPPSISAYELDVVKLTAQFVARNGRQFLTTVMQREQRNYLFDFLRPQHSLFNYFTKLVEQYTKILIPPKNLKEKLAAESQGYKKVLNDINYRVEWLKFQDREKKKEEDAAERERVAYAQIDWHDFVVVETVDFQQNETGNLPPPTTPDEVGARILNQERYERGEIAIDDAVEMEVESDEEPEEEEEEEEEEESEEEKEEGPVVPPLPPPPKPALPLDDKEPQDMDEDSDEEERPPLPPPPPRPKVVPPPAPPPPPPPPPSEAPPLPPTPDQVVIRKDYNPKAKPVGQDEAPDQYMISPITKEKIPANKVQEHMRIGLLDPKWMEERQRTIAERQDQEEVLAAGSDIDVSLKQLAERRTDIFGIGTEETQIGKKIGEEEKRASKVPVMWDGHTASMEKVSQRARENISIEEQIHTIHKTKGLLPDEEKEKIGPAMPKSTPAPPPPPPVSVAPPPPPMSKPAPPPPPAPPVSRPPMPPMQPMPPRPPMGLPGMLMMQGPHMGHPMAMNPMMGMRPPMPPMQQQMGMGGPGMGGPMDSHQRPGISQDEPPSKKQKTEDNLIPEEIFLQKNKGPVSVKVMVPNVSDKPEWKLNGQTLEFSLPLTDTISVLKAKLNEALGMPAGKQKLQYEGIFVKDSNTLAFYNFTVGAAVQLQMKERGGRKK